LQFIEKAHVLDRDDGLIGEGFEEGNLLLGKRSNLSAADHNSPDSKTLPKQGCG
jgi:hypothetical protein